MWYSTTFAIHELNSLTCSRAPVLVKSPACTKTSPSGIWSLMCDVSEWVSDIHTNLSWKQVNYWMMESSWLRDVTLSSVGGVEGWLTWSLITLAVFFHILQYSVGLLLNSCTRTSVSTIIKCFDIDPCHFLLWYCLTSILTDNSFV